MAPFGVTAAAELSRIGLTVSPPDAVSSTKSVCTLPAGSDSVVVFVVPPLVTVTV